MNTHKAVHIGHIRNILMSESISRILAFAGNEVKKLCYPGDIGAHVAKRIRYYTKFSLPNGETIPQENFAKWMGEVYAKASQKVEENPEIYKEEIQQLQIDLENGNPELQQIWKETRELCISDLSQIFKEL